jgi:hypothetical protein
MRSDVSTRRSGVSGARYPHSETPETHAFGGKGWMDGGPGRTLTGGAAYGAAAGKGR